MDWKEQIVSDLSIEGGSPVIKGTQLTVDYILDLVSQGWSFGEIKENYPVVTTEAFEAVCALARESIGKRFPPK